MPAQLVRDAIEQSRTREPATHAMALLTAARVLAYMDLPAAAAVYADGVTALPCSSLTPSMDAVLLGIPAHPSLAVQLYRSLQAPHPDGLSVINALVQNGQFALAVALLEDLPYPAEATDSLLRAAPDTATQARILHAALARWRRPVPIESSYLPMRFYGLFARHFGALPPAEAATWTAELLAAIRQLDTEPLSAQYGDSVRLSTRGEVYLFDLLPALRAHQSPAELDALFAQYPAVAAAARVYPDGPQSSTRNPTPATAPPPPPRILDIPRLLDEAHHLFREDIRSGNAAPRIVWPSAHAYNLAAYHAARQSGMPATRVLTQIPDTDLVIRATMEFAAGVIGIPLHHSPQRFRPSP